MPTNRALVLALDEAEQEALEAVMSIMRKHGLPCYLMEPIVAKIYNQLLEGKNKELMNARVSEEALKNSTDEKVGDPNV